MKSTFQSLLSVAFLMLVFTNLSLAQQTNNTAKQEPVLKTYLIEREIPGAGNFTPADLKGISQKSCSVLKQMGNGIQWVQSYVTGNKVFCIYKAENETLIREHAKKGGFPVNKITEIGTVISPATADEK